MQDLPSLSPNERELEARLGRLHPASPAIRRDALMFRAGQAAGQRLARRWRVATTTLLACGLVAGWPRPAFRNGADTRQRLVSATTSSPPAPAVTHPAPAGTLPVVASVPLPRRAVAHYLLLREQVVREGLEALPSVRWAPLPEAALMTAGAWRPRGAEAAPLWPDNPNERRKRS